MKYGKNSFSESYARAGVDITAGYKSVELIKRYIARTTIPGAVGTIGGFGGLFQPDFTAMQSPTLVSGTDGVGTKTQIAIFLDRHDTIGIDCVAMCVNDIVCCGAKPLFFLDYIACGKNYPEKTASIVSGIAEGCIQAGCALIGGETAEHPGVMLPYEYDLAGFAVGIVDCNQMPRPDTQKPGDVLIGLPSSGVHANGFSLIRKLFSPDAIHTIIDELGQQTLGEALLTPTAIYVKPILNLLASVPVKAIAHITGGGFYENISRTLPDGITAHITRANVPTPPIFDIIARASNNSEREMFNIFNMGIGMTVSVAPSYTDAAISSLRASGIDARIIGCLAKADDDESIRII
ncbi:phosphoribosylformylglycinamidine cyclo-ligase [Candidatus Saccharibacteria bacterium]|nr:phosphoribosylformylglycinamidine cyclo-ligase [Candidatus Saccharibacteria bacterium]